MLYLGPCPTKADLVAECRRLRVPYSGKSVQQLKNDLATKYKNMPIAEPAWLKEAEKMVKNK